MRGPFQFGTPYRFVDFTDGLGNALLVGEKQVAIGYEGVGWNDCSINNGDYFTCSARSVSTTMGLTTDIRANSWLFGSRHTVVHFCFADGRVQGLRTTINPRTLELLGMRSHGEILGDY